MIQLTIDPQPRLTPLMHETERRFEEPLIQLIPRLVSAEGHNEAASTLNISKAGLGYWMLKLGISMERIAVPPGHNVVIIDADGTERVV